jgi:ABC-type uncharacterized transport system ATPase subunit
VHCGGCEKGLAAVAEQPLTDTLSQQRNSKRGALAVNRKMEEIIKISEHLAIMQVAAINF